MQIWIMIQAVVNVCGGFAVADLFIITYLFIYLFAVAAYLFIITYHYLLSFTDIV